MSDSPLEIAVPFGDRSMRFVVGHDVLSECLELCAALDPDRLLIVADSNVWKLHGAAFAARCRGLLPFHRLEVEPTERRKTLDEVHRLLERAVRAGATRRSVVLGFGGGLAGNVAGMVAGLLYRGVRLVHLPTSLLAMSDSTLSMKQAVNGDNGKNLFGLYHLPEATFVATCYLATLPEREMAAGLHELVKNCLAFSPASAKRLRELMARRRDPSAWSDLVLSGVEAKIGLLRADAREKNVGLTLEYGHTVGHALEHQGLGLTHGVAVALGMLVAAAISRSRGGLGDGGYELHHELLLAADPDLAFPRGLDRRQTLAIIRRDNKHGYLEVGRRQHPFVLLDEVGVVASTGGIPLVAVHEDEILAGLDRATRDTQDRRVRAGRLRNGGNGAARTFEQAVILAGGRGTRLAPLTDEVSKVMVPVAGRPFLEYQIRYLRDRGIRSFLLLVGYLWEGVRDYFGDGSAWGVEIRYSVERQPAGTAGCLVNAEDELAEHFTVVYGDSYLPLDYAAFFAAAASDPSSLHMAVYRNAGELPVPNNVRMGADGRIASYQKGRGTGADWDFVDAGVLAFRRSLLQEFPRRSPAALEEDVFPVLARQGRVRPFLSQAPFFDIGTPDRLARFRREAPRLALEGGAE